MRPASRNVKKSSTASSIPIEPSNDAPVEGPRGQSRRSFLCKAGILAAGLFSARSIAGAAAQSGSDPLPWFRTTLRWGQTNITEIDPLRYDIPWWRQYWKRTQVQGVIFNAGGIVAYYPSWFPLQYRAAGLQGRDLFGELVGAAHEEGLAVLARMDSNRASELFYRAHPDWFARDADGRPYRAADRYVTCVNSPYYREYIPDLLREIIERYRPEGVTDNSWSGLGRNSICYCENCERQFRDRSGKDIPRQKNWDDLVYRDWIEWNYQRRIEIWERYNRVTQEAGGPNCLWVGMNSGSISGQSQSFRAYKAICARSELVMLDHQARQDSAGFQENGHTGKLIHGILGWNKLIPESMAMYQAGKPTFRVASKPEPEARLWMLDGFAGGLQPWWHHVGAYHEDRRMYRTAAPILQWHRQNQQYLIHRQPVATVGLVWSQRNSDYFGRDHADELVDLPFRGMLQALVRARIPYLPVEIDEVGRGVASSLTVLVLPNFAAISDPQAVRLREFVQRGGSVIATGDATRCDPWGDPRADFALADIFGVRAGKGARAVHDPAKLKAAADSAHSYLRLSPEHRAIVDGPRAGDEPSPDGQRHPILRGFEETDLLPFGGFLEPLPVDPPATVLATFVPAFPIYPPETAWMRVPRTEIPALIVRELPSGGRSIYFSADIDRRFARDNLPDHGNLLANAVRWAAADQFPIKVKGPGLIDCHLFRQRDRLILHLVNLTNAGTWRAPVEELIRVGPIRVTMSRLTEKRPRRVRSLVTQKRISFLRREGEIEFELPSILDHEVLVVE